MPDNILDTVVARVRMRRSRSSILSNAVNLAREKNVDPALSEMGLGIHYDEKDEQKQEALNRLSQVVDVRALGLEPPPASSTAVAPDVADVKDSYFTQTVLPNAVQLVLDGVGTTFGVNDMLQYGTYGANRFGTNAEKLAQPKSAIRQEKFPQLVSTPPAPGDVLPGIELTATSVDDAVESLKNMTPQFVEQQPLTAGLMTLAAVTGSMGALSKFRPKSYLPRNATKFFSKDVPNVLKGNTSYAHVNLPNGKGLLKLREDAKAAGKVLRVMRSKDVDFPGLNVAIFDPKAVSATLKNVKSVQKTRGFVDSILETPQVQETTFFKETVKPLRDGGVVVTPKIGNGGKFGDYMRRKHTIFRRSHPAGEEAFEAARHAVIKNRVLSDSWGKIKKDYTSMVYAIPDELGGGARTWTSERFGKIAAELDQKAAKAGKDFDFDAEIAQHPQEVQAALRQHKTLTDSIASRIRKEMLTQGVPEELVNKWGRDGFYFPKMFTGNWEISAKAPGAGGVDYVTRAQTMSEAFGILNDLKKKGYTLSRVDFDNIIPGEIAARLPRGQLERLISTLKKNAGVDRDTIMEWFKSEKGPQVIAAKESKKKGMRFKEGRVLSPVTGEEYPFWNVDYDKTMDVYLQSAARYLAMNEFGRKFASAKAKIPSTLSRLHAYLDDYQQEVMGRHYAESGNFDETLGKMADALNRPLEAMGSPFRFDPKPMALERWVSTANKVMANLKLSTPAAAVVNGLQTFQTLYPRVSTVNFIKAWKESFTDAGIERARQAGVLTLPAKLQDIGFTKGGIETERGPLWAFNKMEQKNRVVAYLAGELEANTAHGRSVAKAFGMNPNDPNFVRNYAIDMVAATQFDMSVADLPQIFRGPYKRLAFQFKPFQNALLGSMGELRKMPDPIKSYAKSALGTFTVGGTRTLVSPVRLAAIYGISKVYSEIREKHGEDAANAVVYGLPGLIGMDMSTRVGIDLVPQFGHSFSEKLVNAVSGPTIGTIRDMVEFSTLEKKDKQAVYAYLKRLLPQVKMGHSLWNAIKEDKWLRDNRGKKLAKADPVDRWLEGLGFTTIKRTQAYDVRYELNEPNMMIPDALEKGLGKTRNRIERYSKRSSDLTIPDLLERGASNTKTAFDRITQ